MSSAWVYQKPQQLQKLGPDGASWYVGWFEPDGRKKGKSCGPGFHGRQKAEQLRRKIEAELITGKYKSQVVKTWEDFRKEYEAKIMPGLAVRTQAEVKAALDHFGRLAKPYRVFGIVTTTIDSFVAARRQEPGKKKGSLVSPATVNKDLRHLRAILAVAQDWGYLSQLPKFRMEKVPKKLPRYMPGEHFATIYAACDQAKRPDDQPFPASDWWRALIVTGYMTGWRIGDMLGLRRADLDLDAGTAITRAEDNKGKRDERVDLHPVVVEHLRKLACFDPYVFPWNHYKTTLYGDFEKIQRAAGIKLACDKEHKHTRFCHVYGFHDLRRAFATMNADRLTPDALQALMRHKSYSTTQLYVNMSRQMKEAVAGLHVPEVLRGAR